MKVKTKMTTMMIKLLKPFSVVPIMFVILLIACTEQDRNKNSDAPLKLIHTVSLPDISGRIDHMAFNIKLGLVYIAALGNNTVEVVDLKTFKVVHTIKGLSEPQGIRFIPASNSVFIANGNTGACDIYNADSYQKVISIALGSDADNVRYDSLKNRIYVGYGDGAIAVLDGSAFSKLSDIKLPAHPESFQLDDKKIYVNVPEANEIDVISLEKNSVEASWEVKEASSNFPMAIDKANHRLFIGCRHPAKLLMKDTETGKTLSELDIDGDTDDVFYDSALKQIYVSCGSGKLDVIKQVDKNNYKPISVIKTRSGARTSLFIPELNEMIVAAPARAGNEAQLMIFGKNKMD